MTTLDSCFYEPADDDPTEQVEAVMREHAEMLTIIDAAADRILNDGRSYYVVESSEDGRFYLLSNWRALGLVFSDAPDDERLFAVLSRTEAMALVEYLTDCANRRDRAAYEPSFTYYRIIEAK